MRTAPRPSTRSASALRAALAWALLLAGPSAPAEEPPRSTVEEQAKARLYIVHVRIGTTSSAGPGECRDLRPDELNVILKPGETPPYSVRPPRLKTIIQNYDTVDLDRRVQPKVHALLMDTSASMSGDLKHARRAAAAYVRQLDLDHEKALIATFDETVSLWQGVTNDLDRLLAAVESVRVGGQTAMLDALVYTMRELDAHPERPVLVLLSDGDDTASFHLPEDVLQQATTHPDLTIFTIGIGLHQSQTGETRRLLKRLAAVTGGKFFDIRGVEDLNGVFMRIRDILGTEAIVTVIDPNPESEPAEVVVESFNADCTVASLAANTGSPDGRQPIPKPYPDPPHRYESALTPAHENLWSRAVERERLDCPIRETPESGGSTGWLFLATGSGIRGCGPDVTLAPGLLYDPSKPSLSVNNTDVVVTSRPFEIPVPALGELPEGPGRLMDRLGAFALERAAAGAVLPADWEHARPFHDYGQLVHGTTFLEMRPLLAQALFLYPEYRAFALKKLRDEALRQLAVLEDLYRRQFPELRGDAVAQAARDSHEGRQILDAVNAPSAVDLQPILAAWLGDVSAHDLFLRWERERIERMIESTPAGPADDRFEAAWRELRKVFFAPSFARALAVLAPVRDADCDCIGFWRIMLPRPSLLRPRMRENTSLPLDLVAEQPLAYWTVARMLRRSPELANALREGGFRVDALSYRLIGDVETHGPAEAFRTVRVELRLRVPATAAREGRVLSVAADVSLGPETSVTPTRQGARRRTADPDSSTSSKPSGEPMTVKEAFAALTTPPPSGTAAAPWQQPAPPSPDTTVDDRAEAPPAGWLRPVLDTLKTTVSGDPELQELVRKARRAALDRAGAPGGVSQPGAQ